ncbi:MAG: GFA family protein [Hasllibacter sp.]
MREGACLCGAVRWRGGEPDEAAACRCDLCRRMTSGVPVFARMRGGGMAVEGPVGWYESSPGIRRGICRTCGTYLFWERQGSAWRWVGTGTFEDAAGLPEPASVR